MAEFFNQLKTWAWNFFQGYGLTIVKALALLVLGILVILLIKKTVKKNSIKSRKIDNSAASFVTSLASLAAYVLLAILLLSTLGFSTTGIAAAFTAVALAVSLGLQNTLASLTNGIVLIFTKPFVAGDFVEIGGKSGTVKEIKLFSVKLVTGHNVTVIIPNSEVLNSVLINYSKMPLRRLDLAIPVSYDSNVEKVKAVVLGLVDKDERIKKDPAVFLRLTEWGDSSLNFTLRVWVDAGDYWNVKFDLLENLLTVFAENHIEIPYNQLEVRVVKTGEGV